MKKYVAASVTRIIICTCLLCQTAYSQSLLAGMPSPDGPVYSILKIDSMVYIGGFFSNVNGIPRSSIASFNATTGVLSSWNPSLTNYGVTSLTHIGNKLIAGGSFTGVNGQTRYGICIFDLTTGNPDPWSDTANYMSWRQGVGSYNNVFYYARLLNAGGASRIVCADAITGSAMPWQSDSTLIGNINAIYADSNYVYVGGFFNVGISGSVYDNLCRFDQNTGALDTSWHPHPRINSFGVNAIVRTNSNIFVGGDFDTISGVLKRGVAGYDLYGNLTSFLQNSSSYEVLTLCADGNTIWVGGNSAMLGGKVRYRIAQIMISNSIATCWDGTPTSNSWSTVQAIFVSGDTVYAGPYGLPNLAVFNNSPLPHPGITISGPDSVFSLQTLTYRVPPIANCNYHWFITGGTGSSVTDSINVTWGTGPTGFVKVVVDYPILTNCNSDTLELQVDIASTTAVNLNGGGSESFVLTNPESGIFEGTLLNCSNENKSDIKVYNTLGELIAAVSFHGKHLQLNGAGWPSGIYILKVVTGGIIIIKKLVKE
jgi:hypothetical protein